MPTWHEIMFWFFLKATVLC